MAGLTPRRAGPADLAPALDLLRQSFAYMDGVIDPPSSLDRLSLADLAAGPGELWLIGDPVLACVVLTPRGDALYLGKLAVAEAARGQGLARAMVNHAVARAHALGLGAVDLQTRIELTGNQAAFAALGFREVARTAHPGYDRATSITYRLPLRGPDPERLR